MEKRRLRGEFNCCFPLPEAGGAERGRTQTILRGNDHQVQKGKFWLYIRKDDAHNCLRCTGELLPSEQPDLVLKVAPRR